MVHAIAFSDKDELDGRYVDTTPDNFARTMLISCYSFTALAQRAEKLMPNGGSLLTLSYYGSQKWIPHYNVMGVAKAALESSVRYLAADLGTKNIRVNAISSGPIKTLAALGVTDFRYILRWTEHNAPLRRNMTSDEVGDAALYFLSDIVARRNRRNPQCRCRLSHRRHEASRRARPHRWQGIKTRERRTRSWRGLSSISSVMARPTGMPSAGCKASTTSRSMRSAAPRPRSAAQSCRDLFARESRARR